MAETASASDICSEEFDLVIVGGGMQGLMIALEAVGEGWRVLVLEADRLCSGASGASLRIIHGGLRYLQSLDLRRTLASARDQQWFAEEFAGFVQRRRFLLPLDGGQRHPAIGHAAVLLQRAFARATGVGIETAPRVLGAAEAARLLQPFGYTRRHGVLSWNEVWLPDVDALALFIRRRIVTLGGHVLEHFRATELLQRKNRVIGIAAIGGNDGVPIEFQTSRVVEATGPGPSRLQGAPVNDLSEIVAFNLEFDISIESSAALGTTRSPSTGRSYFLIPYQGKLLLGTGYCESDRFRAPTSSSEPVRGLIEDAAALLPGLGLTTDRLCSIPWSRIPSEKIGTIEPTQKDFNSTKSHDQQDHHYFRVCPAKLTTTRSLALQIMRTLKSVRTN